MIRPTVLVRAEPEQPSTSSSSQPERPDNLTTWRYGKTRDAGLGYFYVGMLFIPLLLMVLPFLFPSPPMTPVS